MATFLRKLVKGFLLCIGILLVLVVTLYTIYDESLPEGLPSTRADAIANRMLGALGGKTAYDNTSYLEWSFRGEHHYKWFKNRGKVIVSWNYHEVALDLLDRNKSTVTKNGLRLAGEAKDKAIEKAWDYFNNDSFWLVAPFKVFDDGVIRSVVKSESGEESLLVTYTSGGSTPGDSYLWKLDSSGKPISYKMWVKILPIGGVEATWEDWRPMPSGIELPNHHKIKFLKIDMGHVIAR